MVSGVGSSMGAGMGMQLTVEGRADVTVAPIPVMSEAPASLTIDPYILVARTLCGEAESDGFVGMCAVASVLQNRVKHPRWWGHDFITVCLAREQFSCWNDGPNPDRDRINALTVADPHFVMALGIAHAVISGMLPDSTNSADSYYDPRGMPRGQAPSWAAQAQYAGKFGTQLFYRVELLRAA